MQLKWLSVTELIAEAGGDPWAINQSLQAGSPSQISSLAEAFHGAGRHTAEADHAFEQARKRFDAAWNHQNGDHPINDSAEVQRLVKSLGAQSEQLPKIGTDLENIAAALAEAQKAGTQRSTLLSMTCNTAIPIMWVGRQPPGTHTAPPVDEEYRFRREVTSVDLGSQNRRSGVSCQPAPEWLF
ncbi:hypothetical protein B6K05_007300 [Mycobacterium avium subsp. hominissuis]|nr:hypothetical protein B6K05_007300 [Mycobacterium avium subsp. hominissuis]